MISPLLSPQEAGEQVSATLESMRAVGATPGQMAVLGAHMLLEHMPEGPIVAEELVGCLEGSGLEDEAMQIISGIDVVDKEVHRQRIRRRYISKNQWPGSKDVEEDDELEGDEGDHQSYREVVMDPEWLGQKETAPLYAKFGTLVDGFITGSPELAGELASIEETLEQYGYWGDSFFYSVVGVLLEEGHLDAALLASNQVHSVRSVEPQLLAMAKSGYKPAIINAHHRFLAEGTYSKADYYSEGGEGMQRTGDFFEAALEMGMHETASNMFKAVRHVSQLDRMIRLAIPDLVERNDFNTEELLAGGLKELTERLLLGIINDFDMQQVPQESFMQMLAKRSNWATNVSDERVVRQIQSDVAFSLGVELCYRGRVVEAEQIEAATIAEHGRATELQRFIGLGHFIVSDLETALARYKEVREAQPNPKDGWLRRESLPFLVKRGAIAQAIAMAGGVYDKPRDGEVFGEHSAYLLSLAVAAAHDVYEDRKHVSPRYLRSHTLAEQASVAIA